MSPTVESVTHAMRKKTSDTNYDFPYGKSIVRRLFQSMEFSHKTVQRTPTRAEACAIIARRYSYFEQIRELRLQGYDDVYLDETWYDNHMCLMKNWTDDSENCVVPISDAKGDRIVIVHCGAVSVSSMVLYGRCACRLSWHNELRNFLKVVRK
ncbi:hypothetical protein ANN_20844 [Periplaneta americana]|uniref:Uncharacterized protein n=1 Tax=Periplaneta americana TaxID=6978 RepID=A0ABQ8SE14_PERAM|nr:hypothetical protein ANN_20844 [Periplaneta americana]